MGLLCLPVTRLTLGGSAVVVSSAMPPFTSRPGDFTALRRGLDALFRTAVPATLVIGVVSRPAGRVLPDRTRRAR